MNDRHRSSPVGTSRGGFTLVELLVTVSVIGVLIGFLLPALSGAREAGRGATCLSNLRQLGLGLAQHADDHDGRCAPAAVRFQTENLHRWHGTRERVSQAFDPAGGPLTPYLGGSGISTALRVCPSFEGELAALEAGGPAAGGIGIGGGFEGSCGGYGYNAAFVGRTVRRAGTFAGRAAWVTVTDEVGAPLHAFARPWEVAAFADAALASSVGVGSRVGGTVIEYSFIEPRWWPEMPEYAPDPSTHFRHGAVSRAGGRANAVFLDGHADGQEMTATAESGVYGASPAAAGLGWFDQPDDPFSGR